MIRVSPMVEVVTDGPEPVVRLAVDTDLAVSEVRALSDDILEALWWLDRLETDAASPQSHAPGVGGRPTSSGAGTPVSAPLEEGA